MEQVNVHIRSCVISTKEKLSLRQLNHDYRLLMGESIPYQELGFKKLEDLIQASPDLTLTRIGSEFYVTAKSSDKSAHIANMIAKQKDGKRKRAPRVGFHRGPPPPRMQQMSRWQPKSKFQPNRYQGSHRPQAVSHSQFVNKSPATNKYNNYPSVASKVVIPEHSTLNNKQPQQNVSAPVTSVARRLDLNQRLTTNRLQENIKSLSNNNNIENGFGHYYGNTSSSNASNPLSNNNTLNIETKRDSPTVEPTDPLKSAMKRLNKKMAELSPELDSGNSSLANSPPPPIIITPDFVRTKDALVDLKNFAQIHKLGEVTVDIAQVKQKRHKFYSCKIKVGQKHTYTSYPNEFTNSAEAQKFCCDEALTDLIPKYKRKSLLISSERDILARIPPMLEKHNHGIWAWQLKLDYSDKYNEVLSDDWLKIIDSSPCVQIEKISEDHILYHCEPGDKGQQRGAGSVVPLSNVSVPANTVQFEEDGKLLGQVTCVMSASEIWCEQINTHESNVFAEMFDRIQIYYQEHETQLIPETITPAGYYIAKYEGMYYRVRAVKITNDEVDCFFIDCGDEVAVPKTDMFILKRVYATSQAQAFVCRLYGLEDLYDVSANSQSLASLCDKTVLLELAIDITHNRNHYEALPVFMYDSDNGHSINEEFIPRLTMELATPYLQPESITEVYISNIESNGDIYVQVRTKGFNNLEQLQKQIEEQVTAKPPKEILYDVTRSNSKGKLYFMNHIATGKWHRTKLIDWSPNGDLVQIYFVDEGNTDVIKPAEETLYPLEALNDVVYNYPHQALRVRMALDVIPANFVDLASKAMPKEVPVLLKIIKSAKDAVPLVKLFKRNTDGGLFCINESIALETELNAKQEELKNRFKINQFGGTDYIPSTGSLKCPPLPKIGSATFSQMYVPVAVSPYNFFVQPFESRTQLDQLMERLQERYKDVAYGNLKVEQVLPGSIYASKHDDGFWYRTSVIKVINSGSSVSVFYCDFGYYQTLPIKELVPLDEEFMDLPYQALKAKVSGIKPKQSKWTMEDCEKFKELIERKLLYTQLTSIEKDILYESDIVLKLVLVDTSSEDDIVISDELIKLGIAVVG